MHFWQLRFLFGSKDSRENYRTANRATLEVVTYPNLPSIYTPFSRQTLSQSVEGTGLTLVLGGIDEYLRFHATLVESITGFAALDRHVLIREAFVASWDIFGKKSKCFDQHLVLEYLKHPNRVSGCFRYPKLRILELGMAVGAPGPVVPSGHGSSGVRPARPELGPAAPGTWAPGPMSLLRTRVHVRLKALWGVTCLASSKASNPWTPGHILWLFPRSQSCLPHSGFDLLMHRGYHTLPSATSRSWGSVGIRAIRMLYHVHVPRRWWAQSRHWQGLEFPNGVNDRRQAAELGLVWGAAMLQCGFLGRRLDVAGGDPAMLSGCRWAVCRVVHARCPARSPELLSSELLRYAERRRLGSEVFSAELRPGHPAMLEAGDIWARLMSVNPQRREVPRPAQDELTWAPRF